MFCVVLAACYMHTLHIGFDTDLAYIISPHGARLPLHLIPVMHETSRPGFKMSPDFITIYIQRLASDLSPLPFHSTPFWSGFPSLGETLDVVFYPYEYPSPGCK